jgi:hypothetical protein
MLRVPAYAICLSAACLIGAALSQQATSQDAGTVCHLDGTSAIARQLPVSVALKKPPRAVRTGDPLDVDWKIGPRLDPVAAPNLFRRNLLDHRLDIQQPRTAGL